MCVSGRLKRDIHEIVVHCFDLDRGETPSGFVVTSLSVTCERYSVARAGSRKQRQHDLLGNVFGLIFTLHRGNKGAPDQTSLTCHDTSEMY